MATMSWRQTFCRVGVLGACVCFMLAGSELKAQDGGAAPRAQAQKQMKAGNWKDAYEAFRKLALDPQDAPLLVDDDLQNGMQCLNRLGRIKEADAFIETVVAAHGQNWRLLVAAALAYQRADHSGAMVSGAFERGPHRGGTARFVNSYERDRVRALQLLEQALNVAEADKNAAPDAYGNLYYELSRSLMGDRGYDGAWRLQVLTDLSTLPDYEDGWYNYGGGRRGAPVNPDGSPVLYSVPQGWTAAKCDGERWRWAMSKRTGAAPKYEFAQFLQNQFGVQTMAEYGWFFRGGDRDDDTRRDESGTWDLHTLKDNETIAKLATGIKRFSLPDEFDFMRLFRELSQQPGYRENGWQHLAREYENRRQYGKAAECWQKLLEVKNSGYRDEARRQLDQILKNWGQFEPVMTQPAGGKGATVEFRFRNAEKVHVEAVEIHVAKLLADIKAYLQSSPKQLDWQLVDPAQIGWRLVEKNQGEYLMARAAEWDLPLQPRPNHWDRRVTVQTPLKKAGAYLLTATLPDGNVSRIILWVADSALVQKPLDKGVLYFAVDALSGRPLAGANLDFFGWRQDWVKDKIGRGFHYEIRTATRSGTADADGLCTPDLAVKEDKEGNEHNYQWLATMTTAEGRLAFLGFNGVWWGNWYDQAYNETKIFVITDRPVYRPEQTAKFKLWLNQAQYDREGKSPYAGQTVKVVVTNPKGEKELEKPLVADEWGGVAGELPLPKGATLGMYQIMVEGLGGAGSFRVEEYKKPEFEVTVDAPKAPVMLGETIAATVQAKYYFGAPVTEGKVKYKVLRTTYDASWYPAAYWDWFYGPGYWWFAPDYAWYPGWRDWGVARPLGCCVRWPGWWQRPEAPELVAEGEVPVGPEGRMEIKFDTAATKAMHGDRDHKYEITAEVTDASRRTIVGQGMVLVARRPFKVYAWVDRGHYRGGDVVHASFTAQTLDRKPVQGKGELTLFKIGYENGKPVEKRAERWRLDTDAQGTARQQFKAAEAGQYRLSYTVQDAQGHAIEGGYVFCVMGPAAEPEQFRFNDIELTADRQDYQPGETVKLRVNTNRQDGTVLLFVRPANGIYLPPKVLRIKGMSAEVEIAVAKRDMPDFFVEAVTVSNGKVFSDVREIAVPPEKRVLTVEVKPSKDQYKPGEKAAVAVRVTDFDGKPYAGSLVLSVYDKAVEYVSGGSNVPEIREFFWKWRRSHSPQTFSSLDRGGFNLLKSREPGMASVGVFGASLADEEGVEQDKGGWAAGEGNGIARGGGMRARSSGMLSKSGMLDAAAPMPAATPMAMTAAMPAMAEAKLAAAEAPMAGVPGEAAATPQPAVRSNFADTALWVGALATDAKGEARVELTMPENLTTWKTKVWAMGDGCRVGEGAAEPVTTKNLIVRLQAPRFFVQKDEVVLSANVHNFLKTKKKVTVSLQLADNGVFAGEVLPGNAGSTWTMLDKARVSRAGEAQARSVLTTSTVVAIPAGGEQRLDWRVKVAQPGEAVVAMLAVEGVRAEPADAARRVEPGGEPEADAMEMKFPVYVHGMEKMESFSGVIRPEQELATVELTVPEARRPEQTRLEIRWSPTLAGAMVDALPYLADYPYGCTEQTLNRFLPTVVTRHALMRMGLNLKEIQAKRSNLNAQEIGDDAARAADWKRHNPPNPGEVRNPVFDEAVVDDMVKAGIERLASMQCADGGWGWFSGWGEHSYPHTTALVVHGLQTAQDCDVQVPADMLRRGVAWLKDYQAEEVRRLNLPEKARGHKFHADDLDAFVHAVLTDAKTENREMRGFLYRDRNELSVYAKAMFALSCHKLQDVEKRDMLKSNIEQFLVRDDENQSAYLKLPENNWWWCWYGSDVEAMAWYLKLLAAVEPKGDTASRLVKYLVNNRRHATYWNSTRDTAFVLESFADYLKGSGESEPDMTVSVAVDGAVKARVRITKDNLFSFNNKLILEGAALGAGRHTVELRREGRGPVYFNAYLTNFTLEDPITKAGLEVKIERKVYKLERVDKTVKAENVRGNAVDQKVEKYERRGLKNLAELKSGDLVEVELEVTSKNDYEYIILEDMKAAGFEPVEVRSGYTGNEMGAYTEFRDERVAFFVRTLARGTHSLSYRLRAEIPGQFSALPAKAAAMYAPELRANSDEIKLKIRD